MWICFYPRAKEGALFRTDLTAGCSTNLSPEGENRSSVRKFFAFLSEQRKLQKRTEPI